MQNTFLFLGTGGSCGVPLIGCKCKVCTSPSAFNKRFRPAGLLKVGDKTLLIDAGPDLRSQALQFGIEALDGVLLTHTHYDHVGGIDDLRIFSYRPKKHLPVLASLETYQEIAHRFHYLFKVDGAESSLSSYLAFQTLENDFGRVIFQETPIQYFSYTQPVMKVTGYRIGNLAYVSDIRTYTEELLFSLQELETLIIGAIGYETSKAHFTIEEAIAFTQKVKAKKAFFTHLSHKLDYQETNQKLPENIRLAYDGLQIPFAL